MEQIRNEVQLALLERNVAELKIEIDSLRDSVHELVRAWESANTLVTFVKWIGGLAVSIASIAGIVRMIK